MAMLMGFQAEIINWPRQMCVRVRSYLQIGQAQQHILLMAYCMQFDYEIHLC